MTTQDFTPEPSDPSESDNVRQMRERIDTLNAENKDLKAKVRTTAFKDAGFDPTTGVGALLSESFKGELTPEAVLAFANEKGVSPTTKPSTTNTPPLPTPEQRLVEEGDSKVEALGGAALPVSDPTAANVEAEIKKAEGEGRWADAIALKNRQLVEGITQ